MHRQGSWGKSVTLRHAVLSLYGRLACLLSRELLPQARVHGYIGRSQAKPWKNLPTRPQDRQPNSRRPCDQGNLRKGRKMNRMSPCKISNLEANGWPGQPSIKILTGASACTRAAKRRRTRSRPPRSRRNPARGHLRTPPSQICVVSTQNLGCFRLPC